VSGGQGFVTTEDTEITEALGSVASDTVGLRVRYNILFLDAHGNVSKLRPTQPITPTAARRSDPHGSLATPE